MSWLVQPSQLEHLCINLCAETMQHFYNTHIFKSSIESCRDEGIHCDVEVDYVDNVPCIDLISSLVSKQSFLYLCISFSKQLISYWGYPHERVNILNIIYLGTLTHCTNLTYLTHPRWYKRNSIIFQLFNLSWILNSR